MFRLLLNVVLFQVIAAGQRGQILQTVHHNQLIFKQFVLLLVLH